jgi:hypothetical protein
MLNRLHSLGDFFASPLCTLVSNRIFSRTLMEVIKTKLSAVAHFRDQFLLENSIQFILDKCHRYGWADTYLFTNNGEQVGYGSVNVKTGMQFLNSI